VNQLQLLFLSGATNDSATAVEWIFC